MPAPRLAVMCPLDGHFFARASLQVAAALVGKELRRRWRDLWLSAAIVETEAYYQREKGSHASLGRTPSREALWAPPGTIYMYYSRGKASFNISCQGPGNAVLIKAGAPTCTGPELREMQELNPSTNGGRREPRQLCAGQTLLARSLALRVSEWNNRPFDPAEFFVADTGYLPAALIQTTRLGIPAGRDGHLLYRFVDRDQAASATENPLRKRGWQLGQENRLCAPP